MQSLAGGDAYVLAGDFNVVPGSAPYRLLTTANLPPNDPAYPPPPRDGGSAGWVPGLAEGLRSAYAVANGAAKAGTEGRRKAAAVFGRAGERDCRARHRTVLGPRTVASGDSTGFEAVKEQRLRERGPRERENREN